MKKKDVAVGRIYAAKVSGNIAPVRITQEHPTKGWNGINMRTGCAVRILSAARLRYELERGENGKLGRKW